MMQSEIQDLEAYTAQLLVENALVHKGNLAKLHFIADAEREKLENFYHEEYYEWGKRFTLINKAFGERLRKEIDVNRAAVALIKTQSESKMICLVNTIRFEARLSSSLVESVVNTPHTHGASPSMILLLVAVAGAMVAGYYCM